MPTYQYACTECGHLFEQVQSFSDDALTVCPECAVELRKVFNAVGVVFKGSGFYRTDSRARLRGRARSGAPTSARASGSPSPREVRSRPRVVLGAASTTPPAAAPAPPVRAR